MRQFAEAERIIAEHPTHFAGINDDTPRFGFWRGSALGLLAYFCASGLLLSLTRSAHFNLAIMAIVWFIGGAIGSNYKLKKRPLVTRRPNQAMESTASRRNIQFSMSSTRHSAATRVRARGSSSCSR